MVSFVFFFLGEAFPLSVSPFLSLFVSQRPLLSRKPEFASFSYIVSGRDEKERGAQKRRKEKRKEEEKKKESPLSLHLAPSSSALPPAGLQRVQIVPASLELPAVGLVGHAGHERLGPRAAGLVRGGGHLRRCLRGLQGSGVPRAEDGVDCAVGHARSHALVLVVRVLRGERKEKEMVRCFSFMKRREEGKKPEKKRREEKRKKTREKKKRKKTDQGHPLREHGSEASSKALALLLLGRRGRRGRAGGGGRRGGAARRRGAGAASFFCLVLRMRLSFFFLFSMEPPFLFSISPRAPFLPRCTLSAPALTSTGSAHVDW